MGIKVETIKFHTYNGKAYDVGDTYDAPDETYVESVGTMGMAIRVDRVAHAKQAAKPTAPAKAKKARATKKK